MRNRMRIGAVAGCLVACCATVRAADWPQWMGLNRDGVSAETGWLPEKIAGTPQAVWQQNVGAGYSGVAVIGKRLYTAGNVEGFVKAEDVIWCLDAETGKTIWKSPYDCDRGKSYPGPRATPTIVGERGYLLSRSGDLVCFGTEDGKIQWRKDLRKDCGVKAEPYKWGLSCSPLVSDGDLIVELGKLLVFDKVTGEQRFAVGDEAPAFSSPVVLPGEGSRRVAGMNGFGLVIYDMQGRKEVARQRWDPRWNANAATPIVSGRDIFVTGGYGRGCGLFRLESDALTAVYTNSALGSEASACVLHQGHIYGVSGELGNKGRLRCVELSTGNVRWEQSGFLVGGGVTLAGGRILHMQGDGQLVIADAVPDAYRELARGKVLPRDCWTAAVLANGRIYCRNAKGEVACLDVSKP